GRGCAGAQSFTLETSSIPPVVCRRWHGTSRTAMIHHVRRLTATWADTCSPATVTLMDTAASLVSARAALTHPSRTPSPEPAQRPRPPHDPTSHRRDSASCGARLALRLLLSSACPRPSVVVGPWSACWQLSNKSARTLAVQPAPIRLGQ